GRTRKMFKEVVFSQPGLLLAFHTAGGLGDIRSENGLNAPHSCLSVCIGSRRAARVAGIHAASRQAAMITSRLARYAIGSVTRTISAIVEAAGMAIRIVASDAASPTPASSP